MAYNAIGGFPSQQLSFSKKNKKWRKECVDFELDTSETLDPHRKYYNHQFIVYMHVNKINGMVYVGITHHTNPNKRWGYGGQKYGHSVKFLNAIKKYGWDNFDHIVLCKTTRDRAIVIEKTMIAYYKKMNMSYNLADGGEGSDCITDKNREALRKRMTTNHPMKGKHHTLEARALISEANKRREYTKEHKEALKKVSELGRKTMRERGWWFSPDVLKQMSENRSKAVLQLDLNGDVLREFSSAKEADLFCSNNKGHHISDVCNGKRKTAYGYKWVYKEERRTV